jgi:phosphate transport system permease protein
LIISNAKSRRWKNRLALAIMTFMVAACLLPLASLSWTLVSKGIGVINWRFLVNLPLDEPAGVGNAILGSLMVLLTASCFAAPLGLLLGLYLSNCSDSRMATPTRMVLDMMSGIPAIVVGMFIYTLVVKPIWTLRGFSMLSGGLALAMIMLPIVARTCEEALKAIPGTVNEAGLALGLPRRRVILRIVLRSAMPAVITGFFLSLARVGGEAAPLLFTAYGSNCWPSHSLKSILTLAPLTQQTASLPVMVYEYAKSPFPEQIERAWGAALLLVIMILVIRLCTNFTIRWNYGSGGTRN